MATTPTQREALDAVLRAGRRSLHTCFPAKVLAYDAAAQTVDVEPQIMRELQDDEGALAHEKLPTLYDVPVQWPRGGGHALTFPLQVGDYVEIQCAEQSLLVWRDSGEVSEPGISQAHGLNGCMARPGWYPDTKRVEGASTTDLVIGKVDGSASIRIKPDGTVVLGEDSGADFVALADKVEAELNEIWRTLMTATAVNGSPLVPPTPPTRAGSVAAGKVKAR